MTYQSNVLALSPAVYFPLDETSGTVANDISGNGHNGTYHGSPTLGQTGPNTLSALFDGVDDYVNCPFNFNPSGNSYTISCFLKVASYANDDHMLAEYTANYLSGHGFAITPDCSGPSGAMGQGIAGDVTFGVYSTFLGAGNTANAPRPSANAWHQYVFVCDSSGGTSMKVYIDCADATSPASTTFSQTMNDTLYLMSRAGSSLFLAGQLSDVALFTSALTPTQIATICSPIVTQTYIGAWGN